MSQQSKDWSKIIGAVVAVGIVAALINQATGGRAGQIASRIGDEANPGTSVAVPAADVATARAELSKLVVRPLGPSTGYDRAAFGAAWVDTAIPGVVGENKCDTRSDILRRDLTGVAPATGCKVHSGTLADPYTGKTIVYSSAHATAVQIDHVVALGAAWKQGANHWSPLKRRQLANDPRNLRAVDGPTNESKSDDTADEFAPRAADQCQFAVTIVIVKTVYGLSVTSDEKDALDRMLGRCP